MLCISATTFTLALPKPVTLFPLLKDSNLLTWIIENQTYALIPVTWHTGHYPLAALPQITDFLYQFMYQFIVPMNMVTFGIQVVCIICIFRITWAKYLTLCYDAMHIIILLCSGIFFWKWIWLNTAIVISLQSIKNTTRIPLVMGFVFAIIMASSGLFFHIVKLAWLDTHSYSAGWFEAIDNKGKAYKVPSNYYGPVSITFAQGRIGAPFDGMFPNRTFGSTTKIDIMNEGNNCRLPVDTSKQPVTAEELIAIQRFIHVHHAYILENIDEKGIFNYDAFPHHIWSNPFLFKDFYYLDKRDIVAYRFVVEANCVDYIDHKLTSKLIRREAYDIPIEK